MAKYSSCGTFANNISDPAVKCVVRYRNHTRIPTIGELCNKHPRLSFSFSKMNIEEILRKILKLETSKACQGTDIPIKTIKENADIFTDNFLASFNDSVKKSHFPSSINANITPVF